MKKLLLIPLPAIIIGSLAMYINGVSINIWGQNIFGLVIGMLLSYLISRKPKIIGNIFTIPIAIILLLLTFIDSGLEGVHRWISIGPVRFYIASIVLPILIMGLWRILKATNWWIPAIISIGVSLLLALQPDASQTTAFIIPMAIILFSKANNNYFRYSVFLQYWVTLFLSLGLSMLNLIRNFLICDLGPVIC
ncbi:MAG: hypothetical protein ACOYEH_02570 [Caldicoprobacterales bacterium]|jgi:cell division protein FtsW (lipid II flippase)